MDGPFLGPGPSCGGINGAQKVGADSMNTGLPSSIDANAAMDYLRTLSSHGLRPNTLLVCSPGWGDAFAQMAMCVAADPFWYCPLPGELVLPTTSGGTLLLNDVARLRRDQQVQLMEWSERGDAQIISLTELPLYANVRSGDFLERLYYRLNIVRLDVDHDL